jgi:NAD(P)-dependent dehydrogenase (short-subunit alcohol dehydrogenase family)
MRLANKSALIIGGTSGIGLQTAQLFLSEGAKLAVTGRDPGGLRAAIETLGNGVYGMEADLRDVASLRSLARDVVRWSDGLDVLFVNAGVSRPGPLGAVDEAFFDAHLETNLRGPFFVVQELAPLLRRGASVIFTTSCLGLMGRPGMAVYAASKAALRSLVRTLGAELVERGIRVNAVAPGPVDSGIHAKMGLSEEALAAMLERTAQAVPMRRLGRTEEIAEAVLYLASDVSSFTTGHELVVDGGWSAF